MEDKKFYVLPELPYGSKDLEPHISETQLKLHHDKHHLAYVNGANGILERMDRAREAKTDFDQKATLKELSFHIGGHILHSLFWANMAPAEKGGGGKPVGALAKEIEKEFGSFERFKKEFSAAAVGVEGSGWAALAICGQTRRPIIMQVEKHNFNVYPTLRIMLVLDVWEHAYYLDYKNERAKFVEAFWNVVNWAEAERRFEALAK
ncbi:MAG: Superoxide dismutase (Fe) [Methanosaeta sp. PtaB.Bin039]|nr:MAG: Superoxide dismutase (Fe) [Methanosaeta sp. PtaB.Bin039]HOT06030.1 superoxide dismutase [Methanotrichaceae archaeon]HQF16320.1 superoxide dismutase [Methanotrichaceae archaeon]HQI90092.1 superoxide dismutase [Methanotrichaceae archaeon]HQJ27885.1 superoxide dismutase [Methanotrichaceae archaeon]